MERIIQSKEKRKEKLAFFMKNYNSKNREETMNVNVGAILDRLRESTGVRTDVALNSLIGFQSHRIGSARTLNNLSGATLSRIIKFCGERNLPLDYIFYGKRFKTTEDEELAIETMVQVAAATINVLNKHCRQCDKRTCGDCPAKTDKVITAVFGYLINQLGKNPTKEEINHALENQIKLALVA